MNKLFIGLLIVAAGAGVYFLLTKKKATNVADPINKELILGKWNGTDARDSASSYFQYEFQKNGLVLISAGDSIKTVDTASFDWNKENQLLWKMSPTDSLSEVFSILKLNQDSLQVMRTKDSAISVFTRAK